MRKAGCTQISYGVESGSEKIRNRVLNKNIKTHEIKAAFDLTTPVWDPGPCLLHLRLPRRDLGHH